MAKIIQVKAGDSEDQIAIVEERETMKDAKRRACYLASDEFARNAEMSRAFGFVAVYVNGENVFQVV